MLYNRSNFFLVDFWYTRANQKFCNICILFSFQKKLLELEGIKLIAHAAYSPDYYLFRSMAFSDMYVCYHWRYKEVLNGFYKESIMLIFGLKFHLFLPSFSLFWWGGTFSEDRDLTTNSLVLTTTNSELHDSKTCKSDSENDATTENKHVLENDKNARHDQKETYSEEGEEVRRRRCR